MVCQTKPMWLPSLHDYSLYMINIPVWSWSWSSTDHLTWMIIISAWLSFVWSWLSSCNIISEWLSSLHDHHLSMIIIIISTWSTSPCDHVHHHQLIIISEWLSSLHGYHFSVLMIIIISEWWSSLHDHHVSMIIIIISTWSISLCNHDHHYKLIILPEWLSSLRDHHFSVIIIIISTWLTSPCDHVHHHVISYLNDYHLCTITISV
jgi:hypothetical protein